MEKKLKSSYLDEGKQAQLIAGKDNEREELNKAVEDLRENLCIDIKDVDTLKAVNREWVKQYIKKAEESYYNTLSPFVVKTVQKEAHAEFAQAYEDAAPICDRISRMLSANRFNIKQDSKGRFWFDEKEVKAWAAEQATTHYTEEEREFCNRASLVFEQINEFEQWAVAQGFEPFFTKEETIVWQGGASSRGIVNHLTDVVTGKNGMPTSTHHVTFNPRVFRNLLESGFICRKQ